MEKNDLFEKRMAELSKKAYYRGILTYSDFLDLNEQSRLSCLSLKDTGTAVQTFGGYDSSQPYLFRYRNKGKNVWRL